MTVAAISIRRAALDIDESMNLSKTNENEHNSFSHYFHLSSFRWMGPHVLSLASFVDVDPPAVRSYFQKAVDLFV